MVKHNTSLSRQLLETLKDEDNVIAIIPEKELFNRTTLDKKSIAELKRDPKVHQKQKNSLMILQIVLLILAKKYNCNL